MIKEHQKALDEIDRQKQQASNEKTNIKRERING